MCVCRFHVGTVDEGRGGMLSTNSDRCVHWVQTRTGLPTGHAPVPVPQGWVDMAAGGGRRGRRQVASRDRHVVRNRRNFPVYWRYTGRQVRSTLCVMLLVLRCLNILSRLDELNMKCRSGCFQSLGSMKDSMRNEPMTSLCTFSRSRNFKKVIGTGLGLGLGLGLVSTDSIESKFSVTLLHVYMYKYWAYCSTCVPSRFVSPDP